MPTPTYVSLATITLGSTEADIEFSSIPATYRDLVLVCEYTTDTPASDIYIRLNGATSGYTNVQMSGSGSVTASGTFNTDVIRLLFYAQTGASRANMIAHIMDYSATDKHKTVIGRVNNAALGVDAGAGRYASTDVITSVTVLGNSPRVFQIGSTFSLYGIAA